MENFLARFDQILDKHLPLRKLRQREFKQKFKPWISNDILNKIDEKNKTFRKYMKCKNLVRKDELFGQFKNLKSEITSLTRTGKKAYYQKYFTENKDNLQKVWKGIKEIINIKSKNFDYPTCLSVGESNLTDPTAITNSFNDYFTTIADEILKNANTMVQDRSGTFYQIGSWKTLYLKNAMKMKSYLLFRPSTSINHLDRIVYRHIFSFY